MTITASISYQYPCRHTAKTKYHSNCGPCNQIFTHEKKNPIQIIKSVTIFELHTFAAVGIKQNLLTQPARFRQSPPDKQT